MVLGAKTTGQKQAELIRQAEELMERNIYIRAAPLLEEAAGYNAAYTQEAEDELKRAYLALMETRGIRRKYTELLDKQMSRKDAPPEVFAEAAGYYLGISRITEALTVLKDGIGKTGSDILTAIYESNRYAYDVNRTGFDYVSEPQGSWVKVQTGGAWGIAGADGVLLIPCEYEKISTFGGGMAVVMKNMEIYAVDKNNNRLANLDQNASDFGELSDNRIPVLINGEWRRARGDLAIGSVGFEQIGMYREGYAAAKTGGKWGVVNLEADWLVPAEYDGIAQDGLGRCFGQGVVFVREGGCVYRYKGGIRDTDSYDDARPFSTEGYAAVKRDGKWGYIDTEGTVRINFQFDDALSFGQHLAAVRLGEFWGYINIAGDVVIEPSFIEARSFSDGSAAVLTQRGWQFISLLEFKRGPSL